MNSNRISLSISIFALTVAVGAFASVHGERSRARVVPRQSAPTVADIGAPEMVPAPRKTPSAAVQCTITVRNETDGEKAYLCFIGPFDQQRVVVDAKQNVEAIVTKGTTIGLKRGDLLVQQFDAQENATLLVR